jgi:hypothetical protein
LDTKENIPEQRLSLQSIRSDLTGGLAVIKYNRLVPYLERVILWTALIASSTEWNALPAIILSICTDTGQVQLTKLSI